MNTLLQIIIGVTVCILVLIFTIYIYNREMIRKIRQEQAAKKPRSYYDYSPGIIDAADANVIVKGDDMAFSINQQGGAEMTYNFWLYKEDESSVYGGSNTLISDQLDARGMRSVGGVNDNKTADAGLHMNDILLLLKGEKDVKLYQNMCGSMKKDIMVKCPLIKFDRGTDRITVQFNTYDGTDAVEENTPDRVCTDNGTGSWAKKTKFQFSVDGLNDANYNKKWFMVTVVLRDTTTEGIYPLRNKVNCRIYLNGLKMVDKYADGKLSAPLSSYSILRQNRSPLYVFPKMAMDGRKPYEVSTKEKLKLAGGRYFNYSLDDNDVVALFKSKFEVKTVVTTVIDKPEFSDREETERRLTAI